MAAQDDPRSNEDRESTDDARAGVRPEGAADSSMRPPARASAVWRRGEREPDHALAFAPVALPALAEAARCEATLLFADLFGYSAFTEERDIEQVAAVVGAIKHEAARIVHAHGGIVNQFVGDEIMALFGFPKGKEDAPRRAIEAALELHAFVRSADLRHWLGAERPLRLHSGIDAGVVLMRTRDVRNGLFELTGAAVNRAARLRSLAGADELLVSQRVHARIAPFFSAEQRMEEGVASRDESTTPYRIVARRDFAPPVLELEHSILPARSELAELQRFWMNRGPRMGGVVVVQGAAGSGKSRLLASFAAQLAREGVITWPLACRDDDRRPFSALSQLVAAARGPSREVQGALHALGPQLQRASAGPAAAPSDPQAYTAFIKTAAELIAGQVESAGQIHAFLIDDVQWLDPSSRAVLTHLGEQLFPQGHIFVCAARDDERSREALERFRAPLHTEQSATIQLGPLSAEDASGVVAEYLGPQHRRAPGIVEQLTSLSDGTPLSLLELLELLLENKYIQAHEGTWQLDPDSLRFVQLSASARALIERRVAQLAPDTVDVLQASAIMRGRIDVAMLSQVLGREPDQVQAALDDAALARMIELDANGAPRFAHDTIWEVLLSGLSEAEQRGLHQRVVRVMRAQRTHDARATFELAQHCAAGLLEEDPRGAFEILREAAQLARGASDDALALMYLKPAQLAAALGEFDPGREFFSELAEASMRVGELDAAFASFQAASERSAPGFERAHVLGRMAWIRHYQAQGVPAFNMLQRALAECGRPFPQTAGRALALALAAQAQRALGARGALTRREREILCGLYGEMARVCAESSQNLLSVAAGLCLGGTASALPPCRERVQADVLSAFFLMLTGARSRSRSVFERALASAEAQRDPQAVAYCHQIGHVIAGWQGDIPASAQHAQQALVRGGQYLELGELCLLVLGMYTIETYRGHVERALSWLEPAIARVREAGHAPAVFSLVEEAACCALVSCDRQDEIVRMKSRLRFVKRAQTPSAGIQEQIGFQIRAQYLIERDDAGEELEQLIAEFERHGLNPRSAHMSVVIFYVQVAHARVHQCLRAAPAQRGPWLAKLRRALSDVETSTRLPLMFSHTNLLRAAYAYFSGELDEGELQLCAAEKIARDEGVPWVSCAAARLRAHMLREQGKHEAALDQARVAALYARQHGQRMRLRSIRDEFALDDV